MRLFCCLKNNAIFLFHGVDLVGKLGFLDNGKCNYDKYKGNERSTFSLGSLVTGFEKIFYETKMTCWSTWESHSHYLSPLSINIALGMTQNSKSF